MDKIYNRGIPTECNTTFGIEQIVDCVKDEIVEEYKKQYGDNYYDELFVNIRDRFNKYITPLNIELYREYSAIVPPSHFTFGIDQNLDRKLTLFSPSIYEYILVSLNEKAELQDGLSVANLIDRVNAKLKKIHFTRESQLNEYKYLSESYGRITKLQDLIASCVKTDREIKEFKKIDIFKVNSTETENITKLKNALADLQGFKLYEGVTAQDLLNGKVKIKKMTVPEYCEIFKRNYKKAIQNTRDGYAVLPEINSFPIEDEFLESFIDKEKFALLVALSFLSAAYKYKDNRTENLSYVTKYIDDYKDSLNNDIKVFFPYDFNGLVEGNEISISQINNLYLNFLFEHPEVPTPNKSKEDFLGYSLSDVHEYVLEEEAAVCVDFDFLVDEENVFNGRDNIEQYRNSIARLTDAEKRAREEAKIRILDEKLKFFEDDKKEIIEEIIVNEDGVEEKITKEKIILAPGKTNRSYVIFGKNRFSSYRGYVYSSGKVILERYFKDNNLTTPDNYAMYIMKIEEFLELCKKSKTEIINDKLCDRLPHKENWQDETMKIINVKATADSIKLVNSFRKILKSR